MCQKRNCTHGCSNGACGAGSAGDTGRAGVGERSNSSRFNKYIDLPKSTNGSLTGADSGSNRSSRSSSKSTDNRFRDYLIRTNLDIVLIALFLAWYNSSGVYANEVSAEDATHETTTTHEATAAGGETGGEHSSGEASSAHEEGHSLEEEEHEEREDALAVLFPWFSQMIGVFVYYFLSRFCHAVPYTAIMFIIGTCIGIATHIDSVTEGYNNYLTESASYWIGIDGEVILLVFLPGLLFLDSYNIDVHLFVESFWQLITFAFPMVLAGTSLTACVAYYIFPYGWSLDLAMTFGSILSATDPVAVSVLLNELGAPPRLKMHISGESLLNDGSAVVFFNIFSARFFYELGLPGIGRDIGWGEGFALFFRLAFGGACIGIAFGIGAVILLFNLNRRLSGEDGVIQVVSTLSAAYLVFFTSEILAHCSGIIAVLFYGLMVKAFGETLISDVHLFHHFWENTEHLLNTLLFALGGVVWGDIISADGRDVPASFGAKDWGYLVVLYLLLTAIRFGLLFIFYPCTARIGIGTNWKEAVFMAYGGLRGVVGIALALSLNAEIESLTNTDAVSEETRLLYQDYTKTLFGFVGGISLMTLVINGSTSGPVLKKLGLVTPTETRKKIVQNYYDHMVHHTLIHYVGLLSLERFQDVDFSVVREHVPFLANTTYEKLMDAVEKHKEKTPHYLYNKPNLAQVIPYIYKYEDHNKDNAENANDGTPEQIQESYRQSAVMIRKQQRLKRTTVYDMSSLFDKKEVDEERHVFIQILRSSYHKMIEYGELESRGFIPHTLLGSLDYASDAASKGYPLNDWDSMLAISTSWLRPAERVLHSLLSIKRTIRYHSFKKSGFDTDYHDVYVQVRQAMALIRAHERTQKIFKEEFSRVGKDFLTEAEKIVLDESRAQVKLADDALSDLNQNDVKLVKSHYACQILLNRSALYFETLAEHGLMTAREAGEYLEEIEVHIMEMQECRENVHKDEMVHATKVQRISTIPPEMLHPDLTVVEL